MASAPAHPGQFTPRPPPAENRHSMQAGHGVRYNVLFPAEVPAPGRYLP